MSSSGASHSVLRADGVASAESRRQTASHQESGEPQKRAVSPEETHIPKRCTLDSWHESQITSLAVRCIGKLPALLRVRRDAEFSCISDCGEADVRASNKCREDRLSRLALAEGRTRACETRRWPALPYSRKHEELHGYADYRSTSTVDWFPELHPAPPAPVI